jgi:hypothetical protein
MSAYKQFTTKDIVITPFSANKGFTFTGNEMTASNVGVEVYYGTQPPANKLIFETTINPSWQILASSVSGSQNATGFVSKLNTNSVYSSVMQLYYSNYFGSQSGSLIPTASILYGLEGSQNNTFADYNNINIGLSGSNNIPIGAVKSPQYDNYLSSTIPQIRTALVGETSLVGTPWYTQNFLTLISIPSKLWGNNIEPQSFNLRYQYQAAGTIHEVYDDGDGNLLHDIPSSENQYCGNIIYEHGNAILTPISSSTGNPISTPLTYNAQLGRNILFGQNGYSGGGAPVTNELDNLTIGWSSSVTLYEHQYKCTIRENEFGYSLNPSLLSGSQTSAPLLGTNYVYKDFATGSYFSPYITTVGLYDNDKNLLAIGKLSVPTKVPMNADLEIQVAFDSY